VPVPNPASLHQAYQALPRLSNAFVTDDDRIAPAWYRLLIYLWQITGFGTIPQASVLQVIQTTGAPELISISSGGTEVIGTIALAGPGVNPIVLAVTPPGPFVFTAPSDGFIVLSGVSAPPQISRDGVHFYICQSNQISLREGDTLQLPFQAHIFPQITWWSDS
jgi:hypothetical protein